MPFICVVCRDKLTLQGQDGELQVITSTECGHLFHKNCLKVNFEKMAAHKLETSGRADPTRTCPTCHREIVASNNRPVFPAELEDTNMKDKDLHKANEILQEENFMLKGKVRSLEMRLLAPTASKRNTASIVEEDFIPIVFNPNPTIEALPSTQGGQLKLEDLIVWFGGDGDPHNGVVKWIGKINNELYSGIEFEEAIGNNYPEAGGRTLFICAQHCGRLVRTRELLLQKDFYGD